MFDCTLIGDTSLEVSPACHYHLPPALQLNVLGQIAAFLGVKKYSELWDSKGVTGQYVTTHGRCSGDKKTKNRTTIGVIKVRKDVTNTARQIFGNSRES
jgi:hypothetical protein